MSDTDGRVWVGLRMCGCCAAVVVDEPEHKKDTERSKREFLKSGLSVVSASWQEWLDKYRPTMVTSKGCIHSQARLDPAEAERAVTPSASAAK